jgi:hypothetical protein
MAVVVASIWEYGWNTPIKEFDLWHYPLKDFGVDELAMTPVSGIRLNNKVKEFDSVEELVKHYGLPVIICTEYGDTDLKDFEHPKDALYLFNRTSGGELPVSPDYTLRISTQLNKGLLWGHQAASIILYDRFTKWQYQ